MWHVGQGSKHLARLVGVVVDRLLARDDKLGLLLVDDRLQQLRDRKRLQLHVGFHQNAAIGTDRHRGAQRFLTLQ